ncbi:MAG: nucleotidyltransferase family protein [Candidatus Omnitrophica bacterium]|nr:nucleotidyltransferase family protein [Candidatus Omnitrophota bacterium]
MPPVVILAGGLATRLRPMTETIPKAMLSLAEEPFIAHQLRLLKANGITHVVLCCGYLGEQIEEFVGDGKKFGLSVSYSYDGDKLLGTGGAIKKALPFLGDVFFVMYGDSYLPVNFKNVYDYFIHGQVCLGLMTVLNNKNAWDNSNIVFEANSIVVYDKKQQIKGMDYIDYGLGLLRKEAFNSVYGDVFDLSVIYQDIIAQKKMAGYEVFERFYEIGSPAGLAETENYIKSRRKYGAS